MRSSAIEGLAEGEDGEALWSVALGALPTMPPQRATQSHPQEPTEAARREAEARAALEEARASLESERTKATPDYDPIQTVLEGVVAGGGTTAIEARAELRTLATLREASALKADLERERNRRAEEVLEKQKDLWDKSREKDPLGSAFTARGVLEQRTGADGIARYFVRFGGQISCEVACTSGRYDLGAFAGTEIGIHGSEVTSRSGEVPTYEIGRLEVLAVR